MIERIIEASARHKAVVFVLVAAAALCGWWSMRHVALDAIPDLGDTQVIVCSRWDRSPDLVEDQVTYPIVAGMLGGPRVKEVRGLSDFGTSFVYVVFEDGTDPYWARSRVLEALTGVLPKLPPGVKTELGPDATGVGWVFQYALVDRSGRHGQLGLSELRSVQDFYLRNHLKSVQGVAEVASLGGAGRQYQINVDPNRLRAHGLSISRVVEAVRGGNADVGGRLIEFGGTEYMVRGRGYAKTARDFEDIVLVASDGGTPIRVKDVGQVSLGPELRRGVSDLDGTGEVVSGIVVMRQGENALDVIGRVRAKLAEVRAGLPAGAEIVTVYDRSELIQRAIDDLVSTLIEVAVTVSLIILVFLWHLPSAVIPIITIPVAVLISFIPFRALGLSANIMSLGGIAIAIGALVDAAIVVVEQSHKKLEERPGEEPARAVLAAIKEVGPTSFFALLVLAASFLPVLTLEAQEGRLFRPLAYTKTLAIVVAAILTITLDPALRLLFARGRFKVHPESAHPVSRALVRAYAPVAAWALRWRWAVLGGAASLVAVTIPVFAKLGSELMPPLDEGALLYMPSTMPGISVTEAQKLLQVTDRIILQFPEVERVMGKAGRADTATDPAPLSMLETLIVLKPRAQWRRVDTWYAPWAPEWAKKVLRHVTPDHLPESELVAQLDAALQVPGLSNAWTMPIKGRIDMVTTGLRTPVGLKVQGADPARIDALGARIEGLLAKVPGTRSVFAERAGNGYFVDVEWNREALARHGLGIDDAASAVQNAIGGENVTTTVEGRARYPVNVRYLRDFRSDVGALGRVLVPAAGGQRQIPLGELARIRTVTGPSMLRDENGLLTGYVYVDLDQTAGRDPAGYIADADRALRAEKGLFAPGDSASWSGQYVAMARVRERLAIVVPLTLLLVFLLLYASTRSLPKALIVMLAVPFSAVGAIWLLYALDYNVSVAVWVGLIALLGVDAETGVFMLLYLDLAYEDARRAGKLNTRAELREAILNGAVKRIRPKVMTVAAMGIGLAPILWSTGTGSDVMKRIAAPMVGGLATSFLLELLVYPAIYELWKWTSEVRPGIEATVAPTPAPSPREAGRGLG
jgi:Cu(I)/Ag(I) efflux system membrane protein CusA/SilA